MSDEPRERKIVVQRTARYFEAGGAPDGVRELWYVLHGYAELAADVMADVAFLGTPARRIVVPEGLSRFYRRGSSGEIGASWMTREARADEVADYVAYLDALHAAQVAEVGGAAEVTVLGFSQGTATACRWAALGSVAPARVVVWGGALPPDLDVRERLERVRGREHVVGERDAYVTQKEIDAERTRVEGLGLPFRLRTFVGGHRLDAATLRVLAGQGAPRA